VILDCSFIAATLLLYSCQKRTREEMAIMMIKIVKVDHVGGGVAAEMIASMPRRILKGFGMTISKSCHQARGFLMERTFFPAVSSL
jgi:hypothetical protein